MIEVAQLEGLDRVQKEDRPPFPDLDRPMCFRVTHFRRGVLKKVLTTLLVSVRVEMFWPRQVQVNTVKKAVSQLFPHGGHDSVRVYFVTVRGF